MVTTISATMARRLRLRCQRLVGAGRTGPVDVVDQAVALQGQDVGSVLRAIALRAGRAVTPADVRAEFDAGRLVRSWPMRATLFATTPAHLAALLHHTAPRLHRALTRRREQLGLDPRTIGHAREVLATALAERPLTRAEALDGWEGAGIRTDSGRGYHLLVHLAIDGLAHWGRFDDRGAQQLLELSTGSPPADPEAALSAIVRSWLAFRAPATEDDLAWWTKLPKTLLRRAAGAIEDLVEVDVIGPSGRTRAWVLEQHLPAVGHRATRITLVPGFDEWILGYTDRSLVASPAALGRLVPGGNGVFRPAILDDGRVIGTWQAGAGRDRRPYELLVALPPARQAELERALSAQRAALQ